MPQFNYVLRPELLTNSSYLNSYIKTLLLIMNNDESAYNYVQFINKSLLMIGDIQKKKKLYNKLTGVNEEQCIETVAELIYMSLWKHLEWDFEFEPIIESKTPDFKVTTDENICFIAEVTTIRSNHPHLELIAHYVNDKIIFTNKDTGESIEKLPPSTQPIEQYKKIIYEIDEKYKKYKPVIKNKLPFVVCFYLPDYKSVFYINDSQIKTALFGEHLIVINKNYKKLEYELYPSKRKGRYGNEIYTGIFCFKKYSDISAILFINNEYRNGKYLFSLKIYLNPFGVWHNVSCDPFTKKGLSVSYVDKSNIIHFGKPNIMNISQS